MANGGGDEQEDKDSEDVLTTYAFTTSRLCPQEFYSSILSCSTQLPPLWDDAMVHSSSCFILCHPPFTIK